MRKSRQPRCSATISSDGVGKIREAAGPHSKFSSSDFVAQRRCGGRSRTGTLRMASV